jgi:hypothetical protein
MAKEVPDEYHAIIYLIPGKPDLCHIRFANIPHKCQTHERLDIPIVELKEILLQFPNLMGDESKHGSFDKPAISASQLNVIRLKTGIKKDYEPLIVATGAIEKKLLLDSDYRFSDFCKPGGSRRLVKKNSRKLKKSRKTRRHVKQ